MWPLQIDHLGKQTLFWGSQHPFLQLSKEIDGKTFIFRVNLGMWCPSNWSSGKNEMSPVVRVWTHIYGVSKEIDGKTFIFRVNLGMWPLKLIVLEKWALFYRIWGGFNTFISNQSSWKIELSNTHFWAFQDKDGKTFIFRVNLGMWPLKSIIWEKWALFLGFEHTFMRFPRR